MTHEPGIKAVIFDLDGTVIDTFEHIVQAFELVLPKFGVQKTREDIRAVIGKTLEECYREFLPEAVAYSAAELHHETQQSPEMYELITVYESLRQVVDALHEQQRKAAVLTNRSRRSVDLIFAHTGLADTFDAVVTVDESGAPKPDSAGIYILGKRLGIEASAMVMVGDTAIDVVTAEHAGMAGSVGLTHGFGLRRELEEAGADYVIDSLAELPGVVERLNNGED
ncbi:HAD family hydrolase [Candidatus Saccharibacteria bacterium]|nr:MAG: HAD family hydrolase [Candidatus Saccharibacteria bacterium]